MSRQFVLNPRAAPWAPPSAEEREKYIELLSTLALQGRLSFYPANPRVLRLVFDALGVKTYTEFRVLSGDEVRRRAEAALIRETQPESLTLTHIPPEILEDAIKRVPIDKLLAMRASSSYMRDVVDASKQLLAFTNTKFVAKEILLAVLAKDKHALEIAMTACATMMPWLFSMVIDAIFCFSFYVGRSGMVMDVGFGSSFYIRGNFAPLEPFQKMILDIIEHTQEYQDQLAAQSFVFVRFAQETSDPVDHILHLLGYNASAVERYHIIRIKPEWYFGHVYSEYTTGSEVQLVRRKMVGHFAVRNLMAAALSWLFLDAQGMRLDPTRTSCITVWIDNETAAVKNRHNFTSERYDRCMLPQAAIVALEIMQTRFTVPEMQLDLSDRAILRFKPLSFMYYILLLDYVLPLIASAGILKDFVELIHSDNLEEPLTRFLLTHDPTMTQLNLIEHINNPPEVVQRVIHNVHTGNRSGETQPLVGFSVPINLAVDLATGTVAIRDETLALFGSTERAVLHDLCQDRRSPELIRQAKLALSPAALELIARSPFAHLLEQFAYPANVMPMPSPGTAVLYARQVAMSPHVSSSMMTNYLHAAIYNAELCCSAWAQSVLSRGGSSLLIPDVQFSGAVVSAEMLKYLRYVCSVLDITVRLGDYVPSYIGWLEKRLFKDPWVHDRLADDSLWKKMHLVFELAGVSLTSIRGVDRLWLDEQLLRGIDPNPIRVQDRAELLLSYYAYDMYRAEQEAAATAAAAAAAVPTPAAHSHEAP